MPGDGTAALLVIEDGACCATAEVRRMIEQIIKKK